MHKYNNFGSNIKNVCLRTKHARMQTTQTHIGIHACVHKHMHEEEKRKNQNKDIKIE